LRDAAIRYLNRYVPSVKQFRSVLTRKVDRTIQARGDGDRVSALELIEKEIQRRIETGELHDRNFAINWVEHLQEKGKSVQQIRSKLYQKGISSTIIEEVITGMEDVSFEVALIYAKKRGFGPFRRTATDRLRKQKDIAAMLRAGHSFDVVKEIMSCSDFEALERLKEERE
jgi:regulatory protein